MAAIRLKPKAEPKKAKSKPVKRTVDARSRLVALKPHMSEKSYSLSEDRNTYVFAIPAGSNRLAIAEAVASQYDVTVESVKVSSLPGKTRRTYRRRGRVIHRGQTPEIRKAYVRLKKGDKLPIFAAVEEAKKAEKEKK